MPRQNTLWRRALRPGWMLLSVLMLPAAAAAAAAEAGTDATGRITPGFERIEISGGRVARPAGDGFERIAAPGPSPASRAAGQRVSVARARPGQLETPDVPAVPPAARAPAATRQEPWRGEAFAPPTPEGVENYRRRLETRLLEKYNNTPEWAGKVARVTVVLSKPLETSVDGTMIRADFDQLVIDAWGKRIPELEREYYIVTFGSGGVRQVRSDPSIRVGLDLEKTYSERAPLAGDPFRGAAAADTASFRPAAGPAREGEALDNTRDNTWENARSNAPDNARGRMPGWWRPEYP